tara:strand:+ start:880 stop:1593 length:714 start_codon:yes stop_codon:yes gene_type:complete
MRTGLIYALNMEVPSSLSAGRKPEIDGAYEHLSALFISMKRKRIDDFAYRQLTTSQVIDNDIGVIVSGAGQENAKIAINKLCQEYKPDCIISSGFCGSTKDNVHPGDVVMATGVYHENQHLSMDTARLTGRKSLAELSLNYHLGNVQTFDAVVYSRENVREDITAVDMESYALVSEAANYGVPVMIARIVSDVVPETKPTLFPKVQARWRIFFRNFKLAQKSLNQLADFLVDNPKDI